MSETTLYVDYVNECDKAVVAISPTIVTKVTDITGDPATLEINFMYNISKARLSRYHDFIQELMKDADRIVLTTTGDES